MNMREDFQCTFIGLGLIGGAIAKALRREYPGCVLYAYNRHPEHIKAALEDGTLNKIFTDMTEAVKESDIIFLCAPVLTNLQNLEAIKPYLNKDVLITDVGSVKENIQDKVMQLGLAANFIGGHPMTGSEKTGYDNTKAELLENAYYILTPTKLTPQHFIDDYYEMVQRMRAIPIVRDANQHDYATAAISHLPHLIAGELVKLVMENDSSDQFMKTIAAGGFKDITRIASSSPEMWQSITESNADNIIQLMDKYIANLENLKQEIQKKNFDPVGELFATVGPYRKEMNDHAHSTISNIYQLYLDIPDESGAIAKVATLLAENNINIRNIGITHNREHQQGVLYIEFYQKKALDNAIPILEKANYQIFYH